jgi:two-component system, NtrC family, sensor kinase
MFILVHYACGKRMKSDFPNLPAISRSNVFFIFLFGLLACVSILDIKHKREEIFNNYYQESRFLSALLMKDYHDDWTILQFDSVFKKNAEIIRSGEAFSDLCQVVILFPDTVLFSSPASECFMSTIGLAGLSADSFRFFNCPGNGIHDSFYWVKNKSFEQVELFTIFKAKRIKILPYILVFLAVIILSLFASFSPVSRRYRFNKQIEEIIKVAERISEKDFDARFSDDLPDELGKLSRTLDKMRIQLKDVFQDLELRIIRRTSGISMRNAELRKTQREILKQNNELKSAYDALKESRDKYEKLIEHLEDEYFFYSRSINGTLLFVSPSVSRILGYEVKKYRDIHDSIYTQNPINELARQSEEKLKDGIQQPKFLKEVFDSNNQEKILEVSEVPVFNEDGQLVSVEGLAQDITEQQKAEELIKEQEEKYRMLFTHASDFIMMYEIDKKKRKIGKFIEVNRYAMDRLGYSLEELRNMTPLDLVAIELWHEEADGSEPEELASQETTFERIWESKDAQILDVEISAHSFKIRNKEVAIAVARDITERKRAEDEIRFVNEELVNQKENLEALVDNLTQTQEQLVQSEKMAALGQLIAGIAHEINTPLGAIKASIGNLSDSLDTALGELPSLLQTQSSDNLKLFSEIFELSRIKKPELSSREKRQIRKEISAVLTDNKIDNADLLADSLVYLEIYTESLHALVPSLKHPDALQVVRSSKNFISLLKNTNTINIAVEKATKVVFALKKYAHRDTMGEKVPTDIIDSIETVLTLYHNQLKQGIEVVKEWEKLPPVLCYQDEISQIWTNLIQNAIQAMHLEGTLTIKAHLHNDSIFVSFIDTGMGIEPDIKDKIFEPFFTTKKQGEGSGLGLDIVKKIIEKHNGSITVESELGEGAKFTIKLPLE